MTTGKDNRLLAAIGKDNSKVLPSIGNDLLSMISNLCQVLIV